MPTTTDPRTAVLSAMAYPPYNERSESRCTPWDDAVKLLDAYRAKELRMAAEAIEQEFLGPADSESERDQAWNDAVKAIATTLRQSAANPEE